MSGAFTQADFDKWVPARVAIQLAFKAYSNTGYSYLVDRLASNLMLARAENYFLDSGPKDYGFSSVIPLSVWKRLATFQYLPQNPLWNTGLLEVEVYEGSYSRKYKFFGVRFDPEGLEKALPSAPPKPAAPVTPKAPPPTPPPPTKHAGGAPPKDIWERVWIEIAAKLYSGDLQPKKLADLEDAVVEVVMSLGDSVGEATARRHAKPLWDKIKPGS